MKEINSVESKITRKKMKVNPERQEISQETLDRIGSLPRIDYDAYMELVIQKQITRTAKIKPKTIFFDEEAGVFLFLNKYHNDLQVCGAFSEVEETV
jgi:hypothetical protein